LIEGGWPDLRENALSQIRRMPAARQRKLTAALTLRADERAWLTAE
jgi:hypothetical protein